MTTVNVDLVNTNYGNSLNYNNPIFKDIISNLISSGLFNDNLAIGSDARLGVLNENTGNLEGSIQTFNNLNDTQNTAIALEVIVDSISRAILKAYQEGFDQALKSDGASNIGYSETSSETNANVGLSLNTATNVHEALNILAREIVVIKSSLASLGYVIPPQAVTLSPKAHVK